MIAGGFVAQTKPEESLLLKLQTSEKDDCMQANAILLGVSVNTGDKSSMSRDRLVHKDQFISCQLQCNKALRQSGKTAGSVAYELMDNT